MVLIAVGLLSGFPPGIFFPQMAAKMDLHRSKKGKKGDKSSTDGAAATDASQDVEMAQPAARDAEKTSA